MTGNRKNSSSLMRVGCRLNEPVWVPAGHISSNSVPAHTLDWLLERDSLTRRLQDACSGCFRVEVTGHQYERPLLDEVQTLNMRLARVALVRQVLLYCDTQPWVFARSVIPKKTMTGRQRRLGSLGNKPLGAVLFADKSMRRDEMQIARITPEHAIYNVALQAVQHKPREIWGRRSVFYLDNKPLLVSEIFLPGIKK